MLQTGNKHPHKKLPSKEELQQAITEFHSIQWDNITADDLQSIIPWPLKAMSITPLNYPTHHYIYRARAFNTFSKDNIEDNIYLPSSFSYPPKQKARLNRANYEGQSIFYGASNLMAAIAESRNTDNLDFVGCWKIKEGHSFKVRPYISDAIQNTPETFANSLKRTYEDILTSHFSEEKEIMLLLDKFHEEQFTKTISCNSQYLYTAWLTNQNIHNLKYKDNCKEVAPNAVMYQSCLDSRLGTNLAIDPGFVDSSMELVEVYLFKHELNVATKTAQRLIWACGIPLNGKIHWKRADNKDWERYNSLHAVSFYATHEK